MPQMPPPLEYAPGPMSHKKAVVNSLVDRARNVCSEDNFWYYLDNRPLKKFFSFSMFFWGVDQESEIRFI